MTKEAEQKIFELKGYLFTRFPLRFFTVIIASTKKYTDGDEYCTLNNHLWVTVRSKKNPKSIDMIPATMVSEDLLKVLAESMGVTEDE